MAATQNYYDMIEGHRNPTRVTDPDGFHIIVCRCTRYFTGNQAEAAAAYRMHLWELANERYGDSEAKGVGA